MESSYVYILTNKLHTVLYVGVTTSLSRRMKEHAAGQSAFTRRYNVHKLIYAEEYRDVRDAIAREKQIKSWSRKRVNRLSKFIVEGLIGRVRLILDLGRNATAQQSDCRVAALLAMT